LVLRGVEFDGARAVPQSKLTPAWARYLGKAVSLSDMRAIGRNAEAIYTRAGFPFIAVLLKVQEVQNGVVHYDVVEGRISDLTIIGSDPVARRQATAVLEPLVNRAPLSLGDVESAYEIGRKVPGLSISGALRRGDKPGGMDMVVDAKRESWRTFVNVNNLYADAVGPWGVLVGADYFGSSEYGDTTSLQVYTSVPVGRQVLVRASRSQGLDSRGLTATISGLWGTADPKGDFTSLDLATDIEALRLELSQPLWERPNASLVATAAFDASDQRTRVFHTVGLSDDKLRIFSAGLAGEVTGVLGRLAATAEVRKGVDFAGASREGDANLSRVGGDPEATVFRGGLEGESAPISHLQLAVRIDAQQSDHPLTAPDQYSIGNLTIGRGFQPGAALGDSALGGSLEARVGPFDLGHHLTVRPFAFVDEVRLWNHGAAPFSQRTLSSVGGGVRLQVAGKVNIEIVYAAPRQPPLGLGEPRPSPSVLFTMTIGLNDAFAAIHRQLAPRVQK
jgi:hemolysin activation/secretion protein